MLSLKGGIQLKGQNAVRLLWLSVTKKQERFVIVEVFGSDISVEDLAKVVVNSFIVINDDDPAIFTD
jgi:dTDP-4-dehydrorhamnose reductase